MTLRVTSATSPFTWASTYGTTSPRLALRPNRPNVCPYPATTESIVPDTFSIGSAGSTGDATTRFANAQHHEVGAGWTRGVGARLKLLCARPAAHNQQDEQGDEPAHYLGALLECVRRSFGPDMKDLLAVDRIKLVRAIAELAAHFNRLLAPPRCCGSPRDQATSECP